MQSVPITTNFVSSNYVREDEETVAATLTFKVKKCFDNKVNLQTLLD
jgi:hypothetical protein